MIKPPMQQFLLGHSNNQAPRQLVKDCLDQIGQVPDSANFGFIYATYTLIPKLDIILDTLRQRTGVEHWSGSVGLGVSATGQEYYDQPALTILLADFPDTTFRTVPVQTGDIDNFIHSTGDWLKHDEFYFGILHCDPGNMQVPSLISALAQYIPNAFFVGGLSSSGDVNVQVADTVVSGGISGVLFSSEVPVATGHTQGCTPFTPRHVISACERNIIIELDNRPALDVFREDVGEVIARDLQRVAGYIFAGFPIPGSDTSDYMVRNLVGIDEGNRLIAVGQLVTEGSEIMFCRRDGNTARQDMLRMLTDIKGRLTPAPRGAVYYSCTGRGRYQFGPHSEELKLIRAELGDLPLVGFFANGEIFHNRLYGYTGVLTVFC